MKKLLPLSAALLMSCSMEIKTLNEVQSSFPGADVAKCPGYGNHYVVRDTNGAIWFVESTGPTHALTGKAIILQPRR
jgi:hypothetical protein